MRILNWILVACVALLVVLFALSRPLHDFVEFWVSAHQFVARENPYSFSQTFQLEHALGWSEPVPLLNMNPPWVLPLIAPLGLAKSYVVAWLIWVSLLTIILWWSTRLLIDLYSGGKRIFPSEPPAREPLLAFTFFPSIACLKFAQITPVVLLGVAGFLWFENRKRHVLAGICLALAAFKPHLVYLILLAVLFRSLQKKNWEVVSSFVSTICLLTAITYLMRPTILAEYWQFARNEYFRIWPSAIGALLRYPFGSRDPFLLQFVPPLLGTVWFLFFWRRKNRTWEWKEQMPVLITASILTTAYGWTFDQVLLVIPIVAIAAGYASVQGRLPQRVVMAYTAVNVAVIFGLVLAPRISFILAPLAVAMVLIGHNQGREIAPLAYSRNSSH